MRVLLVKPAAAAIDFGLAPFFQTEPLGLQYVASALAQRGHTATIADMRFDRRRFRTILEQAKPDVVGISGVHILDADALRALASEVEVVRPQHRRDRRRSRHRDVSRGAGRVPRCRRHRAGRGRVGDARHLRRAARRRSARDRARAAAARRLVRASPGRQRSSSNCRWSRVSARTARRSPGISVTTAASTTCRSGRWRRRAVVVTAASSARCGSSTGVPSGSTPSKPFGPTSPRPARTSSSSTTRSGPVGIGAWRWPTRSSGRPARKNWLLVQSRLDTVVEHPDLLERWRPLARSFDIFFGFEAPTSRGLRSLHKDADVDEDRRGGPHRAQARLRRDRQLHHRSRLHRGATSRRSGPSCASSSCPGSGSRS